MSTSRCKLSVSESRQRRERRFPNAAEVTYASHGNAVTSANWAMHSELGLRQGAPDRNLLIHPPREPQIPHGLRQRCSQGNIWQAGCPSGPRTWISASEMVARYLASRVMAMALMPLSLGQLSNIVCTGMLQNTMGDTHFRNRTTVVHPHYGMPLRHKKEWSTDPGDNTDEPWCWGKRARHQRLRVVWFHLHQISGIGKFMEIDSRCMLVPGGCGWRVGEWVVTADGFRVSFRGEGTR